MVSGFWQSLTAQSGVLATWFAAIAATVAAREMTKAGASRMPPLHPGEMFRKEFLIPLGMTAQMLAQEIKVPKRRVLAIVKEEQSLDGEMCLRLGRFFPNDRAILDELPEGRLAQDLQRNQNESE